MYFSYGKCLPVPYFPTTRIGSVPSWQWLFLFSSFCILVFFFINFFYFLILFVNFPFFFIFNIFNSSSLITAFHAWSFHFLSPWSEDPPWWWHFFLSSSRALSSALRARMRNPLSMVALFLIFHSSFRDRSCCWRATPCRCSSLTNGVSCLYMVQPCVLLLLLAWGVLMIWVPFDRFNLLINAQRHLFVGPRSNTVQTLGGYPISRS